MFEHAADQTTLLQSESPLTTEYTPPEPVNREQELARIADAVRPLTDRRSPENLLLFGPAGTGKTLLIDHVRANLQDETRVATVAINCWQYNTRSALLTELLIQLGYPAPRKGKPVDALLARLREWLDKHYGVLIVLEEFDQLTDQAEIAYDLQETGNATKTPVGLVLISNQPPAALELEPRSHSRLAYQPIEIPAYTVADLTAILHDRVEEAFYPDTVTDEAIERIARDVAAQTGDCREALTGLLRAARLAEQDNADAVTSAHIQ